jgi:hypothetical protein
MPSIFIVDFTVALPCATECGASEFDAGGNKPRRLDRQGRWMKSPEQRLN